MDSSTTIFNRYFRSWDLLVETEVVAMTRIETSSNQRSTIPRCRVLFVEDLRSCVSVDIPKLDAKMLSEYADPPGSA